MCILCHQLTGEADWSDAELGVAAGRVTRDRRRAVVDSVLKCYGLRFRDDPVAAVGVVSDGKGRSVVAARLPEIWPAASELAPRRLDPLDSELLEQLGGGTP